MSTLFMIRHGQASFGQNNYDKLSEMGITQSFFLGEYWVNRGEEIDAVFSGIQERQQHTARIAAEVFQVAKLDFPKLVVEEKFNEYDAHGIMTKFFPQLLKEDARLQEIFAQQNSGKPDPARARKAFQEVFEIVMNSWINRKSKIDGLESWDDFNNRVIDGLKKIISEYPDGKTIALFTSGGPISAALKFALDLSYEKALDMSWVIKNASVTEFRFKRDKFTLIGFNQTPHFHEDGLITYR